MRKVVLTLFAAMCCSIAFAAPSNAVYDATCGLCHQAAGAGLQGQFPRLAGRVDRMAGQAESREFLIQTVLHGMAGRIEVDGVAIVGVMPPFASLPDRDLASVLNYLVALGGSGAKQLKPITTAEISTVRKAPPLSATQVLQRRNALAAAGSIP